MSVNTLCVHLVLSFHQSCVSHFKYKDTIKPSLAKNHQERSTRIESHFSNIRTRAIPEAKGVPKAHWVETSLTENVETYSRCASLKDRGETRKCTGLPYTIRACTDITLATVLAEEAATRLMRCAMTLIVSNKSKNCWCFNSGRHKTQSHYCPEVTVATHYIYAT